MSPVCRASGFVRMPQLRHWPQELCRAPPAVGCRRCETLLDLLTQPIFDRSMRQLKVMGFDNVDARRRGGGGTFPFSGCYPHPPRRHSSGGACSVCAIRERWAPPARLCAVLCSLLTGRVSPRTTFRFDRGQIMHRRGCFVRDDERVSSPPPTTVSSRAVGLHCRLSMGVRQRCTLDSPESAARARLS